MLRHVVCTSFSAPVQLLARSVAATPLPPSSVRIQVKAAGVNFADHLQVKNLYQEKLAPPFVAGFESYGQVVESTGSVKVGDWVCCSQPGAFSSSLVAPDSNVFSFGNKPAKSRVEAAALLVTYRMILELKPVNICG